MIKKISLYFMLFIATTMYASDRKEGMITVLQAPLFEKPNTSSKVIDYLAKGKRISLNPMDTEKSDLLELSEDLSYEIPFLKEMEREQSDFYQIFDKRGREAYILRKHLVILHNDHREFHAKSSPQDSTDYRLSEPLPENYPFKTHEGHKTFMQMGYGNLNRSEYEFNGNALSSFGRRYDFSVGYVQRANFKNNERFYIGALTSFQYATKGANLGDRTVVHRWMTFGLGPLAVYDPWRSPNKRVSLYISMVVNLLYQNQIIQRDIDSQDIASFNGYSLSPRIGGFVSWTKKVLGLDPIIGFNLQSDYVIGSMKKSSSAEKPQWWPSNQLKKNQALELTFSVGIQKSI